MCTIVVRTAQRSIRRRRLMERFGLVRREPVNLDTLVASTAPPDVAIELRGVYGLLDSMPEELGAVLLLQRVDCLQLEEIAAMIGVSVRTVKRKLRKAESLLDKRLRAKEYHS
jgi:DNA-directed RNA polymerase specialized sigma24 family protein